MNRKNVLATIAALAAAAGIWLPCVHLVHAPRMADYRTAPGVPPSARALAARHLALWTDSRLRAEELAQMRRTNAEWDFMGRTFLVLALANMSLREPAQQGPYLAVMDQIIEETLRLEREKGLFFFTMDYAREREFVVQPARSLFLDGEIALMLAARQLVAERADYAPWLRERVELMEARMRRGPVLCAESYPDECWMFCNTVALAAMRLSDRLEGTDHRAFFAEWLAMARAKLTDPKTGLLVSSFDLNGRANDGPEGSSIWMAAHCLQIVDPAIARDQYDRARRELARSVLGYGFAREWPRSWVGPVDVDSGPVIPLLGASASSSGQAILAAAAFGDDRYLRQLLTSLNLAGFPIRKNGALRYAASNQVGDAVLLYALVQGPLWQKAGAP